MLSILLIEGCVKMIHCNQQPVIFTSYDWFHTIDMDKMYLFMVDLTV